jgi:hypothetical protein
VHVREIVFPLKNLGKIQPTLLIGTLTVTVTVVVESEIVVGATVTVPPEMTLPANTPFAAEVAPLAVPPGTMACRQARYAEYDTAFAT